MKYFLLVFLSVSCSVALSQTFPRPLEFSQHLTRIADHDGAIHVLKSIDRSRLESLSRDSVEHYIGFTYYLKKQLDSSSYYLRMVSDSSGFYDKSFYYHVISDVYGNRFSAAKQSLLAKPESASLRQLWLTEYAGIALLERNYQIFDSIAKEFDYQYFPVASEQKDFVLFSEEMKKIRRKNPAVAGLLSAVIPGSGKWYAGYRGKAISSFVTVTLLGAVAAENYIRQGPSPGFWVFSSLCTVFYVGNIWGSVLSVQIKRDETYREFDRNILVDLHIPLRRIFN